MQGQSILLTEDEYNAAEGVRKSSLDLIALSPLHYKKSLTTTRDETQAMTFGRLLHCLVLEPDEVPGRFIEAPEGLNRRTNAGKAEYEALLASGKTLVTAEDMTTARAMRDALMGNKLFSKIVKRAVKETAFFSADPETGLMRKAKPDIFDPKESILADIKTTQSALPHQFATSCFQYRYHVQDAYYSRIVEDVTHSPVRAFVFFAVEKTEPYPVSAYTLDQRAFELGDELWRRDLRTLKRCQDSNEWPGYEPRIRVIGLPGYAFNDERG